MLQKDAHEISASEVPMVKSYDMLPEYLLGRNVKKRLGLSYVPLALGGWLL